MIITSCDKCPLFLLMPGSGSLFCRLSAYEHINIYTDANDSRFYGSENCELIEIKTKTADFKPFKLSVKLVK